MNYKLATRCLATVNALWWMIILGTFGNFLAIDFSKDLRKSDLPFADLCGLASILNKDSSTKFVVGMGVWEESFLPLLQDNRSTDHCISMIRSTFERNKPLIQRAGYPAFRYSSHCKGDGCQLIYADHSIRLGEAHLESVESFVAFTLPEFPPIGYAYFFNRSLPNRIKQRIRMGVLTSGIGLHRHAIELYLRFSLSVKDTRQFIDNNKLERVKAKCTHCHKTITLDRIWEAFVVLGFGLGLAISGYALERINRTLHPPIGQKPITINEPTRDLGLECCFCGAAIKQDACDENLMALKCAGLNIVCRDCYQLKRRTLQKTLAILSRQE